MKANELMIGDWVKVTDDDTDDSFIGQVKAIDALENVNVPEGEDVAYPYSIDCLEPIPLTPEILEKNGFDVSDPEVSIYRFEEDGQVFRFCLRRMYNKDNRPNGYSFYAFNVLAIIDSVHELQHAFRICGIDKTIEI